MSGAPAVPAHYRLWGSELSPFALKLRALCDAAGLPYRWLPADGRRLDNARAWWRIQRATSTRTAIRYPQASNLDEYPLVPFLLADGQVYYDSSALAQWLDDHHPPAVGPLYPADPATAFVALLLDEAFDEFGLYMAHHNRWVVSATTNNAGTRIAREFRRHLPPGATPFFGPWFARRQVRRLPYLFSVAPAGFAIPGLSPALTPPSRPGFPPTHHLLDDAWLQYLAGTEAVLAHQPFLLGDRFTVADASTYGQLGMNLTDPTAADRMRANAPHTFRWVQSIRDRAHVGRAGAVYLSERLRPLLDVVWRTFVPLMQQNAAAHAAAQVRGERLFNERAFDRGQALYDGTLLGHAFRAVVKTFQVRVWQDLCTAWAATPADAQARISWLAETDVAAALQW